MGIRFSIRSEKAHAASGTLGIVLKRITSIYLPKLSEGISIDMFKSEYLPYETSETYRTILTEHERRCAVAMVETQRQLLRGV
jgi:hypothetical protein